MSKFIKIVFYAGSLYAAYHFGEIKGYIGGTLALLKAQKEKEEKDAEEKEALRAKIREAREDVHEITKMIEDIIKENLDGEGEKFN